MEQPTPIQQPQPVPGQMGPVQTGKSSDPFKVWAIVLGILFLAAAGFAVWQTLQVSSLSSKVRELETTNSGLAESLAELTGSDSSANAGGQDGDTPVASDTEKILAATDAHVRAPVTRSGTTFEYEIVVNKDGFARVLANVKDSEVDGSGTSVWLKKVGDNWTALFSTQDTVSQETIDLYGLPDAVLQQ